MAIINTIVLKVASPCNLLCTYCYEYQDDDWKKMPKFISEKTVESLINQINAYCKKNNLKSFSINCHGGEPMLLGSKGLKKIFNAMKKHIDASIDLRIGMQTNAVLASKEISEILKDYKVSIGISLDGDEKGTEFRIDHSGKPAFDKILRIWFSVLVNEHVCILYSMFLN